MCSHWPSSFLLQGKYLCGSYDMSGCVGKLRLRHKGICPRTQLTCGVSWDIPSGPLDSKASLPFSGRPRESEASVKTTTITRFHPVRQAPCPGLHIHLPTQPPRHVWWTLMITDCTRGTNSNGCRVGPGFEPGLCDTTWTSQVVLVVKNLPASAGDVREVGSIPGLGRSPGGGNGNWLQYSCLENPMDRGAWQATVYRVTKSWTWLSDFACM